MKLKDFIKRCLEDLEAKEIEVATFEIGVYPDKDNIFVGTTGECPNKIRFTVNRK